MNFWVTIYKASWIVLGVLAIVLCISLFTPQIKQYKENQRKKAEYEELIRTEEKMIAHLKRQQERLQYDPAFVERIAREEFGMARPGETVFRFNDKTEQAPPAVMKVQAGKRFGKRECPSCACEVAANTNRCPICGYEFPTPTTFGKHVRTWGAAAAAIALLLLVLGLL